MILRFGTFHLNSLPPWLNEEGALGGEFDQMVLADQLGLDEVWLAEHNARRYGIVGNCHLTAAAIARSTERIRIGTAVTRLPLHHPLHIAEDLAYVDVLSGGRLDWGIGKGYDPLEFSTYGVPFEEREERWEETFNAVRQIWEKGRTEFSGQFYAIPDAEFYPRPYQEPAIPIYRMVTRSDSSAEWAARELFPMVLGQGPEWDDAKRKMELYAETAQKHGHSDDAIRSALQNCWQLKQMHVAPNSDKAKEEYRDALLWYFEIRDNRTMFGFSREPQPYEYYLEHKSVLVGSPDELVDDLGRYAEYTGIQNVICWFNCGGQPPAQVESALRLFAEEVRPKVDALSLSTPLGR